MNQEKSQIIEFIAVAKEFVSLIETPDNFSANEFVIKTRQLLSLLYLKATFLQSKESVLSESLEAYVTPEHYEFIKYSIKNKLGDYDITIHLDDDFQMNTEDFFHVELSELFADIYQDVGNFILQYRDGDDDVRNDAVWECVYNFNHYWGLRTLILTQYLHRLVTSDEFQDNKE
jgi:hypothetical protein